MAQDKRFNISIRMNIKEMKSGEETDFFDSGEMIWADVPYDGMVILEAVMIGALDVINDAGVFKAIDVVGPEKAAKLKEWKDKMKGKGEDTGKKKVAPA